MSGMWLAILLLVPLVGAIIAPFVPTSAARYWALLISLATLAVAIVVAVTQPAPFNPPSLIINSVGASFSLAVDPIGVWLMLLTAFLMPLAVLSSFTSVQDRAVEYYAWMLALLVVMLGVFVAHDLLLFYVCFELTLIPMFFIIGIWGGSDRRHAASRFFLFTFAGGVLTLAAIVYLGVNAGTFDISKVIYYAQNHLTTTARWWVVIGLLAGFGVKVPLFPVHTWLPLAHTEAPTAGSVILAGVLLKLGTYGLLRLAVPIGLVVASPSGVSFPALIHFLGWICVIAIIYGALVAWVQKDIKKLVAYSSVSHLGFCVLGLLALNDIGMQGSVLYMINHGISTGAMFLVIGMIYERFHTRDINELSGLARRMPVMACFFIFFALASIGLPGLNGFQSEFLTILGAFTSQHLGIEFGFVAAFGVILGAVYMLHMSARVIFGPLKFPGSADEGHGSGHGADHGAGHGANHGHAAHAPSLLPIDIGAREIGILVPLVLAVLVLGVKPNLILTPMLHPLQALRTPMPDPDGAGSHVAQASPVRSTATRAPIVQTPIAHASVAASVAPVVNVVTAPVSPLAAR